MDAGDAVYVPPGWYHEVRQSGGGGAPSTIAVNMWYDSLQFADGRWAVQSVLVDGLVAELG